MNLTILQSYLSYRDDWIYYLLYWNRKIELLEAFLNLHKSSEYASNTMYILDLSTMVVELICEQKG